MGASTWRVVFTGPVRLAFGDLKPSHSCILNDEACLWASKAVLRTCVPQRHGRQTSAAQGRIIPNPDGRTAAGQGGVARAAALALRLAAQLLLPAEVAADACAVRTRLSGATGWPLLELSWPDVCSLLAPGTFLAAGARRCLRQASTYSHNHTLANVWS